MKLAELAAETLTTEKAFDDLDKAQGVRTIKPMGKYGTVYVFEDDSVLQTSPRKGDPERIKTRLPAGTPP